MSAQPKKALSEEGYLALERAAESKSEFFDGEMVAMAGARAEHNEVAFNISVAMGSRLPESCQGYTSDMKVRVPAGANFCPEVMVGWGRAPVPGRPQGCPAQSYRHRRSFVALY